LSNPEIQQQIGEKLSTEPMLARVDVNVSVDDTSVVLTGTANDEQQHDLALRIAKSYAGEREIEDKIQVQQ
jgi:osmotically-inducible protein OsmY